MTRKILAIYILAVLVLLSIVPTIYFFQDSSVVFITEEPNGYKGSYDFFKTSDKLKLFTRKIGSNSPSHTIVFIGDGYRHPSIFFEQSLSDSIFKNNLFYFPDFRGYGKSERFKNPTLFSINHLVDDIESLRLSIKCDSIILLSHGFGTIVSRLYTQKYPNRVLKEILISPIINYDESAKSAAKLIANELKSINPDSVQTTSYFEMEGYSIDDEVGFFGISKIIAHLDLKNLWFKNHNNSELFDFNKLIESGFYSNSELNTITWPSLTIGLLYTTYKTDFSILYKDIKNVSIIIGDDDFFSGSKTVDKIQSDDLETIIISNSGFYPFIENNTEFNSKLFKILKTI